MQEKLRCVIVEDEKIQALMLQKLLTELGVEVLGIASSAREAIAKIDELNPDVVFLDINLGDSDGFFVLENIRHRPYVVFTTAYSEYAVKAFEVYAVDYILKPIRKERLETAIQRVAKMLTSETPKPREHPSHQLIQALRFELGLTSALKIPVELDDEVVFLKVSDIVYVEAFEHKTKIVTISGEYVVKEPVKSFEERLPKSLFLRVHKSFVVNVEHVAKILKNYFGSPVLVMSNGSHVPVGRVYRNALSFLLSHSQEIPPQRD